MYQTRHTFAIMMLRNGMQHDVIVGILGHTDSDMLINHYAKWIDKNFDQVDRKLDLYGLKVTGNLTGSDDFK